MDQYLLGIDVGTTGTKAFLLSSTGQVLGNAYKPYPMHTPKVGWSHQDPQDWWDAVVTTVRSVCADPQVAKKVKGIALSVQGGTMVPVDSAYQPLGPAVVWNDGRCQEQMAAFEREVGDTKTMYRKTGWGLGAGLNAMQIRWMKDNQPEIFEKTAYFLSVPDYMSYRLTGKAVIDLSNVGINQLGNITQGTYDGDILRFAGIREEQLPKILRSGSLVGNLTEAAAQELGLTTDTVLVTGAHDQYAVALGAGAGKSGDILIGSGTCWVVTCIGDEPDFESGLSQSVAAVPGKWGTLSSLSSGGVCLEWMRRNIALGEGGQQLSYDTINEQVAQRQAAQEGLFFCPFSGITGEGSNFRKGSFVGMDLSHDRFHLLRAVMEGVVFHIVWMAEAFRAKPQGWILSGGASNSPVWCQLLADISGLPVRIPEVADLACVGAAILAGVGSGVYKDAEEGFRALAVRERIVQPDPEKNAEYKALLQEYKNMVRQLAGIQGI